MALLCGFNVVYLLFLYQSQSLDILRNNAVKSTNILIVDCMSAIVNPKPVKVETLANVSLVDESIIMCLNLLLYHMLCKSVILHLL
mgnify:CR=1 FL=1